MGPTAITLVIGGEDGLTHQQLSELAARGWHNIRRRGRHLRRWTVADKKIDFTRVPLGGGGLVPNLLPAHRATCLFAADL